MNTKKVANRILFVFFSIMLLLTLYGENLYHLTIPKVVTERVVQKPFPFELFVDGIKVVTYRKALAVPLEAL
ncbi:MAG: hypothetical protein ACI4E2_00500 [Acetatifactor sp.]